MVCPHCKYENGWNDELEKQINGEKGKFYKSILPMQKKTWYDDEQRTLYACPACGKTFINI